MNVFGGLKGLRDVNLSKMFGTIAKMAYFRATWTWRDLGYRPKGLGPKFMSAREAVALIPDGSTVTIGGFATIGRSSIFYWALRDAFDRTGHPRNLTVVGATPQGGRGQVPGTIEDLAVPGLIRRYIVGHGETAKAILRLAEQGHLELHTMSQGALAFLIEAQAQGERTLLARLGRGTFLDPRIGGGSAVNPGARREAFIEARGEMLEYRIPAIDRAVFSAPYADAEGNIYFTNAALVLDYKNATEAARRNGGKVIVAVSSICPKDEAAIAIPAEQVDAIVVNPRVEQVGGLLQVDCPSFFIAGSEEVDHEAVKLVKMVNTFMELTPQRDEVACAIARVCARLFVRYTRPGAIVNIGIGLGEEVARILYESGLYKDITFTTEGGAYGGVPASGLYFGSAVNPQRLLSTAEMFHLYEARLDTTVLGFLQVDSQGNVNVSHRGPKTTDFVGPGGFTDIVEYARTILFVGSWMDRAQYAIRNRRIRLRKAGWPKFVDRVDKVSFSAAEALKAGKRVFYVTSVGVFALTDAGLELREVMPGVDVQRDILENPGGARVIVPEGPIPLVPTDVVTGEDFRLAWGA
jgi:propionate CoA-transferase